MALTVDQCIARGYMPQVDEADIPELLDFLAKRYVFARRLTVHPRPLRMYQRVVFGKVRALVRTPPTDKPALVSLDRVVIDGNHRIAAARVRHTQTSVIVLGRAFADVIEDIFAFPKTYALGDGTVHPIRH